MLRNMANAVSYLAQAKKNERKQLGTDAVLVPVDDAINFVRAAREHLRHSEEVNNV